VSLSENLAVFPEGVTVFVA